MSQLIVAYEDSIYLARAIICLPHVLVTGDAFLYDPTLTFSPPFPTHLLYNAPRLIVENYLTFSWHYRTRLLVTLSTGRVGPGRAWFDWPLARPLRASPPLPGPGPWARWPQVMGAGPCLGQGQKFAFFWCKKKIIATCNRNKTTEFQCPVQQNTEKQPQCVHL
jgi:hypothetical protein